MDWFRCFVECEGQRLIFAITRQYRKLALKGAFTGTFYTKPVLAIMQKMDFFSLAFYISCRDEKLRLANISFQFCHRATKPAEQKKLYSIKITSCITVSKMVNTFEENGKNIWAKCLIHLRKMVMKVSTMVKAKLCKFL